MMHCISRLDYSLPRLLLISVSLSWKDYPVKISKKYLLYRLKCWQVRYSICTVHDVSQPSTLHVLTAISWLDMQVLTDTVVPHLKRRGPDCLNKKNCIVHVAAAPHNTFHLSFIGTVLHLRGILSPQPLCDDEGNVFLWNGEIFDGIKVCIPLQLLWLFEDLCLSVDFCCIGTDLCIVA